MTSMHSANDVGEATHPSQWMHTGIDGVRVVGVHRRVEDTGRDRVDPYSVRREFNAERLRGRRQAALGQQGEHRWHIAISSALVPWPPLRSARNWSIASGGAN